jgi:hypothetical protein
MICVVPWAKAFREKGSPMTLNVGWRNHFVQHPTLESWRFAG